MKETEKNTYYEHERTQKWTVITNVQIRDENFPDPLEEIENIIRETGIDHNVEQERAFRIVGEHLHKTTKSNYFYM